MLVVGDIIGIDPKRGIKRTVTIVCSVGNHTQHHIHGLK